VRVEISVKRMGSRPKRIILRSFYSPGDILMLTAAVRDLHRCYPARFLTDVRTSSPEFWENNPYLSPLDEKDPDVELIDCEPGLINKCNETPYHYLHDYVDFFNNRLRLQIRPTAFKGDIHISALERSWFSQVHEITQLDIPFWIVVAGGKYDVTIKWWDQQRYQEVIDHFRGRIQFVQVGERGNYHPRLHGVIDLRGKTDLRELVRLVYHSQGVLCGVTCLMHLAAAVEVPRSNPPHRPCVVVAGGREPVHWEAYPHHQFIHTIGALPCCKEGGCWKDRTVPLGDGNKRDKPENLCVDVAGRLPRCMDMISAAEVIRRIEIYFDGGVLKYLIPRQAEAAAKGVAATRKNPLDDAPLTIQSARVASEGFIETIPPYPRRFHGRGIVVCGGRVKSFTNAWVSLNMLRRLGCRLPIQLWHLGRSEFDSEMGGLVAQLGVECADASRVRRSHPARILNGRELKPYAILHCPFKEVLLLDADNVPVVNPEFLFETPQFQETGAIFWPDSARRDAARQVWDFCGVPFRKERPFETGAIVVDKERCWPALRLCLWYNENSDFFYKHTHGDKETFHLAFRKLDQPYAMPDKPIRELKGALCQHDFQGRRIFQHRNTDKWSLFLTNKRIKAFQHEVECRSYLAQLRQVWDGGMRHFNSQFRALPTQPTGDLSPRQEIRIAAWMVSCVERQGVRDRTLRSLASTDWGGRPVFVQMDPGRFKDRVKRLTRNFYLALSNSVRSDADYILLLEDDLAFNRFIWENLQAWEPLKARFLAFGSLFNPDVAPLACAVEKHFFIAEPRSVYGSQAFLIAKDVVRYLIKHWNAIQAPPDIRMPRLVAQREHPILYHAPSLVQHRHVKSTWGGSACEATDFNRSWKASTCASPIRDTRSVPALGNAHARSPQTGQLSKRHSV